MTESHTVFRDNLFAGQVLIITGGGSGIGLELAQQAARLGAKGVAICGRRLELLKSAQEGIERDYPTAKVYAARCDIRKPEEVDKFVDEVKELFTTVNILINNAGGQFPSFAESVSPKGFEAVVKNNLLGTWNMTITVATKLFIPQKEGSIVNIIAQIRNGFPGMVHTGAARAGVDNLTKTLSIEWARYGIRVNAVAPGAIKTTGTNQYPPVFLEKALEVTPVARIGRADEVAWLVLYMASNRISGFITGQTYYIDGGQSLSTHFQTEGWMAAQRGIKREAKL